MDFDLLGEGSFSDMVQSLMDLKNEPIFLDVSIAFLNNQPLSPPAKAFLKSMENFRRKENALSGNGSPHGKNACLGKKMICFYV